MLSDSQFYGMFHFDIAGAGWGSALIVVTIIGMVTATCRPTNDGGLRVLIATGLVCVLMAAYGRMHPADTVTEPEVANVAPPIVASDAPPAESLPISSESPDQFAAASNGELSVPIEDTSTRAVIASSRGCSPA
jgi:hypothetical protein